MTKEEERQKVTENIKAAVESKRFNDHVEVSDPKLTREEKDKIVNDFTKNRGTLSYKIKVFGARILAEVLTAIIAKDTEIEGEAQVTGGMIVTCNHFNPTDNTAVRKVTKKLGKKRLNIVCEASNLAMTGLFGYLMNYADTVPITDNMHYMSTDFVSVLKEKLDMGEAVLIYPERAMWNNYRKPRPMMEGAYYYAAKLNVPVLSLFVELIDNGKGNIKHRIHILGTLTPDPEKSVRDNCRQMLSRDTELKKNAYEKCYGKALDYTFDPDDIAL